MKVKNDVASVSEQVPNLSENLNVATNVPNLFPNLPLDENVLCSVSKSLSNLYDDENELSSGVSYSFKSVSVQSSTLCTPTFILSNNVIFSILQGLSSITSPVMSRAILCLLCQKHLFSFHLYFVFLVNQHLKCQRHLFLLLLYVLLFLLVWMQKASTWLHISYKRKLSTKQNLCEYEGGG